MGKFVNKWCGKDTEAAAARPVKAADKDGPTTLTIERSDVFTGARLKVPVEPSNQAELVAHYILVVRVGVITLFI